MIFEHRSSARRRSDSCCRCSGCKQLSLGLPLAYLASLLLIHVPGAFAHWVSGDRLEGGEFVEIGIRYTTIGVVCFVFGVWLARRRCRDHWSPVVQADRRGFALFCLIGGWVVVYGLSPLAQHSKPWRGHQQRRRGLDAGRAAGTARRLRGRQPAAHPDLVRRAGGLSDHHAGRRRVPQLRRGGGDDRHLGAGDPGAQLLARRRWGGAGEPDRADPVRELLRASRRYPRERLGRRLDGGSPRQRRRHRSPTST